MSFEAERARIETHFRDRWEAGPLSNSVVVVYENTNIKQLSGDFMIHRIATGDGKQLEIGGSGPVMHRYVGLVQIDILVVLGEGTLQARKIVDVVSETYRRQQLIDSAGGIITFRVPGFRSMGNINNRYRVTVSCPYHRDIRL